MLPPDSPPGNAGTEQQPASAEGSAPPDAAAGESGTDLLQQADGAEGNTVSLPAVGPAGQSGTGSGGGQARRAVGGLGRAILSAGRSFGQAAAAMGGAVTALPRRLRRGRGAMPASEPVKVRSADVAGTVLARLTVLPAVLILAWLIPGVPLLLTGHFLPFPMTLIAVSLAAALTVNGLRVVPASWPRLMSSARESEAGWTTWFGLLATVAVVAGLTAWQLTEGSEALIVLRDPGTYLQSGYWIAQHGSLPIPETLRAFGGAHAGLHFTSTGFLVRASSVYPAAMPGLPLLLAGAFWVHGVSGALSMGPVLGGLAALTFAGLVGRLVGPAMGTGGCAHPGSESAAAVRRPDIAERDRPPDHGLRRTLPPGRLTGAARLRPRACRTGRGARSAIRADPARGRLAASYSDPVRVLAHAAAHPGRACGTRARVSGWS